MNRTVLLLCPKCRRPATEDHNSFSCDHCQMLWPKECGHELAVKEVPCPNCYGGRFQPCQWCGDSGVACLRIEPSMTINTYDKQ